MVTTDKANKNERQNRASIKTNSRRARRGVGAIIGGTILAMILFTSVFVYFFVFLQNQSTQGKGELQASRLDEEKRLETLIASSSQGTVPQTPGVPSTNYLIPLLLNNTGPLPINATYAIVSRVDDTTSTLPTPLNLISSSTGKATDQVLNPGESAVFFVPAKDSIPDPLKKYHIDIVTSRGNIISTQWPPINLPGGTGNGSGSGTGSGGAGQNNTGINIGIGTGNIYGGMIGDKLKFRTIQGGGIISVTNDTDTITISAVGGIGSGEANDGLPLGCGSPQQDGCVNVYAGKDIGSVHLKFYSLKAGTGVHIAPPDASGNIVIKADGEANRGQNATATNSKIRAIYKGMSGTDLVFRTIQGTNGINTDYSADGNTLILSGPEQTDVVQGTGVLQLDFKSFGVIFPQYQIRNGVDQTGFNSRSANATGYPAFLIPAGPQAYLIERVRNLDPAGNTINLGRSSGMTISQGKCPSGQCAPVFLCKTTLDTKGNIVPFTTIPLTDPTVNISIPPTPFTAGKYVGWQDIALCSNAQNSIAAWNVQGQMSNINSAFMVARGYYAGTNFAYAQTIPYQSIIVANQGAPNLGNSGVTSPNMIACLRPGGGSEIATACASPTSADLSSLKYQDTAANMLAGSKIRVHVNSNCNCGYNVSWVYPVSGKAVGLADSWLLNGNGNLVNGVTTTLDLPRFMEDGTTPIRPGYYTIMLTTGYNTPNNERDAYYFTFQVI